jgi:hypothetical protein
MPKLELSQEELDTPIRKYTVLIDGDWWPVINVSENYPDIGWIYYECAGGYWSAFAGPKKWRCTINGVQVYPHVED